MSTASGRTWRELVDAGARCLDAAEVASPLVDAELLAAHAAGLDRSRLRAALLTGTPADPDAETWFRTAIVGRAGRIPLQHLTGRAPFRHLELRVGPGVFVPRPETELLAGWAVDHARGVLAARGAVRVVDLGTGSGAIAASVASEVPGADVVAVEVDPAAAAWAARNLDPLGVELVVADLARLPDLRPEWAGSFDVVVANPPYIPLDAWESVAPEVRDHDPSLALWGGSDGLDVVRRVVVVALLLLRPGGVLGIEHAEAQGDALPELLASTGKLLQIRDHRDLAGRPRYTTARTMSH